MTQPQYHLFAWHYSYFSAKVRAYMKYKQFAAGLQFEEIFATQEIIQGLMIPATGSNVVPQVRSPNGDWIQDSSEIIDELEARFPKAPVIPDTPKQKLVSYLVELLADEWMLPWGFWERWYYSLEGIEPNQEAFNALQWGRMFSPDTDAEHCFNSARYIFRNVMKIDAPETAEMGPYAGLVQLGVTDKTIGAWTASMRNILAILETHFSTHDYLLGGAPTLGDFALLGPLYPHLYKDPVPGLMMRTEFPLVSEWIERVNGSDEAGYGSYRETRYQLLDGELVARPAKRVLKNDEVPETLTPLIQVFFDEMWPMLGSTMTAVGQFMASDACPPGAELPGKSFYSPVQFSDLQSGTGPLTIRFELRGVSGVRMASPYQIWMLQRMEHALGHQGAAVNPAIEGYLNNIAGGSGLLALTEKLKRCRVSKQFEKLFSATADPMS